MFWQCITTCCQRKKLHIPTPNVQTTVGIGRNDVGGFTLTVEIIATLSGIDQVSADDLIKEAHAICPYSNATKGNIEVSVIAKIK